MSEIAQLVLTIKKRLKIQGVTYRELASALGMSEPSVKRMFAIQRFSLDRLVEISSFLGFTLAELAQEAAVTENLLHILTEAQEAELVSDRKLLLVAICSLNHWTVQDIVSVYRLSEAECIQQLVKLDRLRLLVLLPGNRIRLNVARDFDWRLNGPARRFFSEHSLHDFVGGDFARDDEMMAFAHAMLTDVALSKMLTELRKLRQRLAELHEESLASPLAKRRGVGMLLAMREWETASFRELRR